MSTPELLPCPFCAGVEIIAYGPKYGLGAWVACIVCGLETPTETGVQTEQAIDYWNSRPDHSSQSEIARLRKALKNTADALDYAHRGMVGDDPLEPKVAVTLAAARKALSENGHG